MVDVYIRINGESLLTRATESIKRPHNPDYSNTLLRKSKTPVHACYFLTHDKIVIHELSGNFSDGEISALLRDPWQIFEQVGVSR